MSAPVISAEDLLLMKLDANRHVDLDDALALRDALGPQLDLVYLRQMAGQVGLLDRLQSLFP